MTAANGSPARAAVSWSTCFHRSAGFSARWNSSHTIGTFPSLAAVAHEVERLRHFFAGVLKAHEHVVWQRPTCASRMWNSM